MEPLTVLALAAATGVGLYIWDKNRKYTAPGQVPGGTPGLVSTLTRGRKYAVLAVVTKDITDDPAWGALAAFPTDRRINMMLTATFQQAGFRILSPPTIRNADEMKKAMAGEPSTWVFNAEWLLDQPHVTANVPKWLGNASFYLLPTS